MFAVWKDNIEDVAELTYYALFALQHRGQQAAGIAVSDGTNIEYHKRLGLIDRVFDGSRPLPGGRMAIGHVLYTSTERTRSVNAQPLVIHCKRGKIAIAASGRITNADALRESLAQNGAVFSTSVDAEIIANLIAREPSLSLEQAVYQAATQMQGSYAAAVMSSDTLIVMRDSLGNQPLVLGKLPGGYAVASESCVFESIGAELIRDVAPGEILVFSPDGMHSLQLPKRPSALCIFEFVYFARVDSVIDSLSVYRARWEAGRRLSQVMPVEADLICGVPDSALAAAMGYAEGAGIPYGDCLAKNRYIGRTFIQPEQSRRVKDVRIKLSPLRSIVKDKRIVLVDDSIVRGTTSAKLVDMLRNAGAREVHLRISSPEVRFCCPLGVDTHNPAQLLASTHTLEQMCMLFNADTLAFLPPDALYEAVNDAGLDFCSGCFSGNYPD